MDDKQLKGTAAALRRTRRSKAPYYFSYVAADAGGEPFLCVGKRESATISAMRKARKGAAEPRVAFGRVSFDTDQNCLVFENDRPAVSKRLQRALRKELSRIKALSGIAKALRKARVCASGGDESAGQPGADASEIDQAAWRVERLLEKVSDHPGLSEAHLDRAASRLADARAAAQSGKTDSALRALERLERALRDDLDRAPIPVAQSEDDEDDGLGLAPADLEDEAAPDHSGVDWATAAAAAHKAVAQARALGIEADLLDGLSRQLVEAERLSGDAGRVGDARDRAAEIAATVAAIVSEAREEALRDRSHDKPRRALEDASRALHSRLREAYQQRLLPTKQMAHFTGDVAALDARRDPVLAAFGLLGDKPIATAQVLTKDHRDLLATLDEQIAQHAARRAGWDATAPTRSRLEGFVGGGTEGKEHWDLQTLTEAMDAVRGPLDAALRLAGEGRYDEAVARLGEAEQIHSQRCAKNAAGQKLREALLQQEETVQLCDALDKLKRDEATAGARLRAALRKQSPALTDEQLGEIVERTVARAARERALLKEQLDVIGESQVRVGMQDLSEAELAEIDQLNMDTIQYLRDAAKDLGRELGDGGAIAALEAERLACQRDLSGKPAVLWRRQADSLRAAQDGLQEALLRLRGLGADEADIQPHAGAAAALEASSTSLLSEVTGFEKEADAWLERIAHAPDIGTLEGVREAVRLWPDRHATWVGSVAAQCARLSAATAAVEAGIRSWTDKLAALRAEIDALVAGLRDRLDKYDDHSEVPDAFIAARAKKLDALGPFIDSENYQARLRAKGLLEEYTRGGASSPFPTLPEAVALFKKTLGRGGRFWQSDVDGVDAAAGSLVTVDFAAIQAKRSAFADAHGKRFPALLKAVTARTDAARAAFERDGLSDAMLLPEAQALSRELDAAMVACRGFFGIMRDELRVQVRRADKVLTEARDAWLTETFQGHLREAYEALKVAGAEAGSAAAVDALTARAEALRDETAEAWAAAAPSGQDSALAAHIVKEQEAVEARRAQEAREQEERDAHWRARRAAFVVARDHADDAGVSSEQLDALDRLRDAASDSRKRSPGATGHAAAVAQLDGAIERLQALAHDPDADRATARKQLASLPGKWRAAVSGYTIGIDAVIDACREAPEPHAPAAARAADALGRIRDLFDPAAFDEPVLAITVSGGDSARQARERGLRLVRAYKRHVESNPLIEKVLTNPFRPVPVTNVHRCLNDLDLNLLRSA